MDQDEKFWRGRNVLVTGCTGLLGSWLTEALVERGAQVVGLIRDQIPHSQLYRSGTIDRIRVVRGAVEQYELVHRLLNEYEVDTVFHLAAVTIVSIANRAPLATFESNIKGSWTVLEAARNSPLVTRVVLASSDKAYGSQEKLPYSEEMPLLAKHPYDVSKACAEMIAVTYRHTYGLPVSITRCANLYGGGDLNFDRLIPEVIRAALLRERPVIRSDGAMLRDYLFVLDAVSAYLTLAQAMDDPALYGEAFNFGMDDPRSVLEVAQLVISLSDHPELEPIVQNRELREIQEQYLSSDKARRLLGWRPRHTLEQGLEQTISWYQAFLVAEGLLE
jgi:CDP-glucose 4,6-dehydratase